MDKIIQYFNDNGWNIVREFCQAGKDAEFVSGDDLNLCERSNALLSKNYSQGLYRHQQESIKQFMEGNHVCLSTPTASGKTLAFQICALEFLNKNPDGRILAVFPSLALTTNQKERWDKDMKAAGYSEAIVAKIDGSVSMQERLELLQNSKVIIMTPDVIHAWLLRESGKPQVQQYLKNLGLLIVDEVHSYSGAFGSNAAYMFRRLKNLSMFFGGEFRIISASATINRTEKHLSDLFGENFEIVGKDFDSSKQYQKTIWMVTPPEKGGMLTHCVPLIKHIVDSSASKFIAFIDNRQDAERIPAFADLTNVKAFRAGYEEESRKEILRQLVNGELRGVVSTSALEIGIDIQNLTLGILWGVPQSMTSYAQRIGRVGRNAPGNIIIINSGFPHSAHIFEDPSRLDHMPLSESSLYLGNERVQYTHALCLAMQESGEIDKARISQKKSVEEDAELLCEFPKGFSEICADERSGQITEDMDNIRAEAVGCPHIAFPLRHIESQYKVQLVVTEINKGSLSESQVLREAYPGAIYLHQGTAFRAVKIDIGSRIIFVKKCKRGITKPMIRTTYISPNFREPYHIRGYGDFSIVDAKTRIQRTVDGYQEGGNNYPYPQQNYYRGNSLSFSKITSGAFIHVPDFNYMSSELLLKTVELLFEMFVSIVPYDRQDIDFGTGKFKISAGKIRVNDKFIAIFDQHRGSLRLSARITETEIIRECATKAYDVASLDSDNYGDILPVMKKLMEGANQDLQGEEISEDGNIMELVRPGSVVLNSEGKRIVVDKFLYDKTHNSLVYKGKEENTQNSVIYTIPVNKSFMDDDTEKGLYDFDNDQWLDSAND